MINLKQPVDGMIREGIDIKGERWRDVFFSFGKEVAVFEAGWVRNVFFIKDS